MNVLVISSNYPSSQFPQVGTFVYKLIQEFAKLNNKVTVVSPQIKRTAKQYLDQNYGNELAEVYRPTFWSFSNKKIINWNTYSATRFFQSRVIRKTVIENKIQSDIVYCHFISSALLYIEAFPKSETPIFVAVGEYKNIDIVRSYYKKEVYNNFLNKISGFIAVSPQVKLKLIEIGLSENKIMVAPNGTDLSRFKIRDKIKLREKYQIPQHKKVILFVGRFLENKGPRRVLEAINRLDENVCAIFIGKGPQEFESEKIAYKGAVAHDTVAEFMSLSDVFVLPTLHEGSSNVIIEAMASGLPIVSSSIPEIQVQCDPSFSFLVDPNNIDQITESLYKLTSNEELRKVMSENALRKSKDFDVSARAVKILDFINEKSFL